MQQNTDIATAISSIDLDLSKEKLIELGSHLCIEELEGGFIDPIDRFAQIKQMKLILDGYEKSAKDYVLNSLDHEEKGKAQRGRVLIETSTTGDRLNYGIDEKWQQIDAQKKHREQELKAAHNGLEIVDPDTGELVPKVGLKTVGRTIPKVTIK